MTSKSILALAAAATLLAGCATDPYYDNYGYGPTYYPRSYYYGPRFGFGIGYSSGWRYR